jgi:hypothetical protein
MAHGRCRLLHVRSWGFFRGLRREERWELADTSPPVPSPSAEPLLWPPRAGRDWARKEPMLI